MDQTTRPYLTEAEIKEIVHPLTQPAAIVRWFRKAGFDVTVRPNGMPLISRAHFEAITAGKIAQASAQGEAGEAPDAAALLRRFQKSPKSQAGREQV